MYLVEQIMKIISGYEAIFVYRQGGDLKLGDTEEKEKEELVKAGWDIKKAELVTQYPWTKISELFQGLTKIYPHSLKLASCLMDCQEAIEKNNIKFWIKLYFRDKNAKNKSGLFHLISQFFPELILSWIDAGKEKALFVYNGDLQSTQNIPGIGKETVFLSRHTSTENIPPRILVKHLNAEEIKKRLHLIPKNSAIIDELENGAKKFTLVFRAARKEMKNQEPWRTIFE